MFSMDSFQDGYNFIFVVDFFFCHVRLTAFGPFVNVGVVSIYTFYLW